MPRDDKGMLTAAVPAIKSFSSDLEQMNAMVKEMNRYEGKFMEQCAEIVESLLIHFEANYQLLDKPGRKFLHNAMHKMLFIGIKASERAFLPDIGGKDAV
jgi:hypothetical protein